MVDIMRSASFRHLQAEKPSYCCSYLLSVMFGLLMYVLVYHRSWLFHQASTVHASEVTDAAWKDLSVYISGKISDQVSLEVSKAVQDAGKKQQDALLSKVMKELQRSNSQNDSRHHGSWEDNLLHLPKWVTGTPDDFLREVGDHFDGAQYHFHQAYQPALSRLVRHKLTQVDDHTNDKEGEGKPHRTIRLLEIGSLQGCTNHHRSQRQRNELLYWPRLFRQVQQDVELEYHIFEPNSEACAKEWADSLFPASGADATIHMGNPRDPEDIMRVLKDSGGYPFDIIIDMNVESSQSSRNGPATTLGALLKHGLTNDYGFYFLHDTEAASRCGQNGGRGNNCMMVTQAQSNKNQLKQQQQKQTMPTLLAVVMEYQRHLMGGQRYAGTRGAATNVDLHGVSNIQVLEHMFVFSKEPY